MLVLARSSWQHNVTQLPERLMGDTRWDCNLFLRLNNGCPLLSTVPLKPVKFKFPKHPTIFIALGAKCECSITMTISSNFYMTHQRIQKLTHHQKSRQQFFIGFSHGWITSDLYRLFIFQSDESMLQLFVPLTHLIVWIWTGNVDRYITTPDTHTAPSHSSFTIF